MDWRHGSSSSVECLFCKQKAFEFNPHFPAEREREGERGGERERERKREREREREREKQRQRQRELAVGREKTGPRERECCLQSAFGLEFK
jgi:hypothetical protein